MARKKRLTQAGIDKLRAPSKGRIEHRDSEVPGLVLRINYTGTKTWALYYHVQGKRQRYTIGRHPAFGPKEAREVARLIRENVERGIDPAQKKRDEKEARRVQLANTFDIVAEEYFNTQIRGLAHVQGKKNAKPNKKTWKELRRMLDVNILPAWESRPITSIQKRDVVALLDGIVQRAPYQANNVLIFVRTFFKWAEEREIIEENPCRNVSRPHKPKPRNRPLKDDEVIQVWNACIEMSYPYGDCYRLLLLTGQRRSEVAEMQWGELDLANREWNIPGERTKSGRNHTLPLTQSAREILEQLPRFDGSDTVFTTTHGDKPINGHNSAKRRLDKLAGVKDFQLKDLRETVSTTMRKRLSISSDVAGQVLNHAPSGVTERHYAAEHSISDKRMALTKWDAYVQGLLSGGKGTVIQLDDVR